MRRATPPAATQAADVQAHTLPLLARGTPVSQVAAASGHASDSAFSAMFKAAMGQSPSHFQNKNGLYPALVVRQKLLIR